MTKTDTSETYEAMTLEEAFGALDEMIAALESREITLEESFQKYQQAMELVRTCNDKIDQVEKKVLILNENGEANEF
jgi:exodeoxyribonuclease VII small subunit